MKQIIRNILISGLILTTYTAVAQGFLRADGKRIVNEKGEPVILRGMGLGGWMLQEGYMLKVPSPGQQQHVIRKKIEDLIGKEKTNEFYNAWLINHMRKIDVDSLARWGFNSIRLPIHYNLFTLPVEQEPVPGKDTWLDKGFTMTDTLLQWCKANKIYLILDLHAAPGGQGNDLNISDRDATKPSLWQSKANQQKTVALWRKLAERYANEPWIGAYDIINEPNWGFEKPENKNGCDEQKNEPLRKLMVDITTAIREVDKKHIVIIEGNCWGNNYNGIFPVWDANTVVSFHKYWNYNDEASLKGILAIRDQNNVPVWLGESGENSNLWFRDAIRLVESHDIGWAWWPLKKLGFNNPLEIKMPAGYQKILSYWEGQGPKPTAVEAYRGVMQLASNAKLQNCIIHRDVIDAMFRQTTTNDTKPYKNFLISSHLIIQAADYDLGRNRYAYYDLDTANYYISTGKEATRGNTGGVYRNDGVDITTRPEDANSYYVTKIENGEWLQYTVQAELDNSYMLELFVSAEQAGGKVTVSINKANNKSITIPATGGIDTWKTVALKDVHLTKGVNVIRIKADVGGFNFRKMEFTKSGL